MPTTRGGKIHTNNPNPELEGEAKTLSPYLETKYSSIEVIHGLCKNEKVYQDNKEFLAIALKLLCKIPNESVVECIGSIAECHTKPQRNCIFKRYETELMVDWNGPNLTKAEQAFIEKSLDRHFGSRKNGISRQGPANFLPAKWWIES